jgi:hypothetical protein
MRRGLAIVVFLALTSCDRSIDEIEKHRSTWLANEPGTYSYTIQVSGWRSPRDLLHPKRVTVSDGRASAEYVWASSEHEIGETAVAGTYWSIAGVFDELIAARGRNAQVRARFNQLGFVERAFVEYETDSSGWDVEIGEFQYRTSDGGPGR